MLLHRGKRVLIVSELTFSEGRDVEWKMLNSHFSRLFDLVACSCNRPGKPFKDGQSTSFTGTSREATLSFCHLEK